MKKYAISILLFALAGCTANSIVLKEFKPEYVIHHRDLQKLKTAEELSNYVVYLDKGDTFPLELSRGNSE